MRESTRRWVSNTFTAKMSFNHLNHLNDDEKEKVTGSSKEMFQQQGHLTYVCVCVREKSFYPFFSYFHSWKEQLPEGIKNNWEDVTTIYCWKKPVVKVNFLLKSPWKWNKKNNNNILFTIYKSQMYLNSNQLTVWKRKVAI